MSIFQRFFTAQAIAKILELEDDLAEERIRSSKLAAKLDVARLRNEELSFLLEELRQGIRANIAANVNRARENGAPDPLPDVPKRRVHRLEDAG